MDAAKARIESLNPLVAVETMTSQSALEPEEFDALVQNVDLVCITDSERDFLVSGLRSRLRKIGGFTRCPRTASRERCVPKVKKATLRWRDVWTPRLYLLRLVGA